MNSIHQRVQERKRIQEIGGRVNGVRESQQLWSNWRTHLYKYLGDAEIFSIFVPVSADQAEIDRIKKLFPEADIWTTEEISSGGIWTQPKVKRIWKVRDYIESGMTG